MNLIHPFGLAENQRILSLSPHKPMVESSIKNRAMKVFWPAIKSFIHGLIKISISSSVFINEEYLTDSNPMKMYTSYAIFYISKNLVETDRDVTIITSDSITTGSGLSANMDTLHL